MMFSNSCDNSRHRARTKEMRFVQPFEQLVSDMEVVHELLAEGKNEQNKQRSEKTESQTVWPYG